VANILLLLLLLLLLQAAEEAEADKALKAKRAPKVGELCWYSTLRTCVRVLHSTLFTCCAAWYDRIARRSFTGMLLAGGCQ
jgi:ABC-type sulfate transport system permease component